MAKKKSYEQLANRLDEVLEEISSDTVELDQSIKLYKEGMTLITKCNKYLTDYEKEVNELKEVAEGSFKLLKFE